MCCVIIFANSRITVTLGFCLRPLFTYITYYTTSSMVEIYLSVCSFWSACWCPRFFFLFIWSRHFTIKAPLHIDFVVRRVKLCVRALNKSIEHSVEKSELIVSEEGCFIRFISNRTDTFFVCAVFFCRSISQIALFVEIFYQRIRNIYSQFEDSKREKKTFWICFILPLTAFFLRHLIFVFQFTHVRSLFNPKKPPIASPRIASLYR